MEKLPRKDWYRFMRGRNLKPPFLLNNFLIKLPPQWFIRIKLLSNGLSWFPFYCCLDRSGNIIAPVFTVCMYFVSRESCFGIHYRTTKVHPIYLGIRNFRDAPTMPPCRFFAIPLCSGSRVFMALALRRPAVQYTTKRGSGVSKTFKTSNLSCGGDQPKILVPLLHLPVAHQVAPSQHQ